MSWRAETVNGQITIGTEFAIFSQPWGPGIPVQSLPAGSKLLVSFPNGATTEVETLEISGNEAVIQYGAAKWRMKQISGAQLKWPPVGTAGAPTTYWTITGTE